MKDICRFSPDEHLNSTLSGLSTSATIAIQQHCRELEERGRTVYKLGLGQSPFPVPDIVVRELQKNAHQKDYLPVKGLPKLREVLAAHHKRVFGIECSTENIIIGPGSKELMFLLQLVYDGEIMIPMPAWVSYLPQARILGRPATPLPTSFENGWKITPEQVEAICSRDPDRPRLLILNYPSNPTGQTYTRLELAQLSIVFRKYKVLVLSDEIYAQIHFDNNHSSLVTLYPEGTIFSGGLSKWCGAGGWRLGLFVVPECTTWLIDAMATAASETFTSTSAPIQYAAVRAFLPDKDIDEYLVKCKTILKELAHIVMDIFVTADIEALPPQGGFYIFPDFKNYRQQLAERGITTSSDLCRRLLEETGVAILPGSDFGRDPSELTARIAYIDFDGKKALTNYPHDGHVHPNFIKEYCGKTLEAVQRLADWISHSP